MKRTKKCPKCDSLRIGHVETQIDGNTIFAKHDGEKVPPGVPYISRRHVEPLAPRTVGVSTEVIRMGFVEGDVSPLLGKLEAYVCGDCGFYESYVQDPQAVKWTDIVGFSWVNEAPEPKGAYR